MTPMPADPEALIREALEVVRDDPRNPYDADGYCANLIGQLADALETALRGRRTNTKAVQRVCLYCGLWLWRCKCPPKEKS
jgi:hypothetical protein